MSKKFFVTSDVHSFFDELIAALTEKGFEMDNEDHILCVCGDLFDRGTQPRQLFEFVKGLQAQDRLIYVAGNHERLLFDCMNELMRGQVPGRHHFSNKTVETICRLCGQSEWIIYDPTLRDQIYEIMKPVLDFISDNCVNYVEIGSFTLVHGWIPVIRKDNLPKYYIDHQKFEFNPDWRNASSKEWDQARWLNGMDMWKYVGHPDDTTVICGHWHCSYGWSHLRQQYKEWPQPSHADWDKSFEPFIDNGIIAIDACTVYSGKCNVIVIEEDKINGDN